MSLRCAASHCKTWLAVVVHVHVRVPTQTRMRFFSRVKLLIGFAMKIYFQTFWSESPIALIGSLVGRHAPQWDIWMRLKNRILVCVDSMATATECVLLWELYRFDKLLFKVLNIDTFTLPSESTPPTNANCTLRIALSSIATERLLAGVAQQKLLNRDQEIRLSGACWWLSTLGTRTRV